MLQDPEPANVMKRYESNESAQVRKRHDKV